MKNSSLLFFYIAIFTPNISYSVSNTNINIASFSKINTTPYIGASVYKFVDGKIDTENNTALTSTPLSIKHSDKTKLNIVFKYDIPQSINKIRIYQIESTNRNYATSYNITNGETKNKDTTIATENNATPYKWYEYNFSPPISTNTISFDTLKLSNHKGPSYGGPLISEFEIYTDKYIASQPDDFPQNNGGVFLKADKKQSTPLPSNIKLRKPWEEQFQKGIFSSIWRFDENKKHNSLNDSHYIKTLKDLDITRLWLYLSLYRDSLSKDIITPPIKYPLINKYKEKDKNKIRAVAFKNNYLPYINTPILSNLIEELHTNNIGIIANESLMPVQKQGWAFPRIYDPTHYPCLLTSTTLHNIALDYYDSILKYNFDGITIGGDEFFFYGHKPHTKTESLFCDTHAQTSCNSSCVEKFQHELIEKNTSDLAKFKIFEYNQLAGLFKKLSNKAKSKNIISTSLLLTGNHNRQAYGIANDIIGHNSGLDEMTIDPYWSHNNYLDTSYFAIETKKILAATPSRKAHITLQATPDFNAKPFEDDIMIYGPAIASIMHGISGVNFYKIDYLLNKELKTKTYTRISQLFNFIRFLESNDFLTYETPKHMALLYSRASEDWWLLNKGKESANYPVLFQNAILQSLIKHSIPFDIFYLDQAESIPDLTEYDVTLLPYPYSVGLPVTKKLKNAKNIIALQVYGEVNETNLQYKAVPLNNMHRYNIDFNNTNYHDLSKFVIEKLSIIVNNKPTPFITNSSSDTECSLRKKGYDHLIYCINWGHDTAEINLKIDTIESQYKIWEIDTNVIYPMKLENNDSFTKSQLQNFNISLPARSFKAYLIDEIEQSKKHKWVNL